MLSCKLVCYSYHILKKVECSQQILRKTSKYQVSLNPSSSREFFHAEPNGRLSKVCERAPKTRFSPNLGNEQVMARQRGRNVAEEEDEQILLFLPYNKY